MKSKMYEIKTDLDLERICYATLKNVFSVTLFPRVLINTQKVCFDEIFSNRLEFECFFTQNMQIFAHKVHFFDFDMGIFFLTKQGRTFAKLVDGNGLVAGSFITNIFDNVFKMSSKDFDVYKKQVGDLYDRLDKTKLLFELKD